MRWSREGIVLYRDGLERGWRPLYRVWPLEVLSQPVLVKSLLSVSLPEVSRVETAEEVPVNSKINKIYFLRKYKL